MNGARQAKGRLSTRLATVLMVLIAARFALALPVDMGWIRDQGVVAFSRWSVAVIGVLSMPLLLAIIATWPASTKAARTVKLLILAYLGLTALGGVARRFDWLPIQNQIVDTIYYVLSTLIMLAILLGLMVLAVKDLEERTRRDIQPKTPRREPSLEESPLGKST